MSDGAWEKMPQYLFNNFFICGADPNDKKISIQPLKRTFESLYPTPSERGDVQTIVQDVENVKSSVLYTIIVTIIHNHS